jgi:predicted dehydrogenase
MSGVPGTVPGIMRREQETPVRLGLIGMGRHGSRYIRHIAELTDMKLTALCRRTEAPAQAAGSAIPCYTDYRQLIDDPDVDAVIVVTPPSINRDICLAAVRAKKPLLIEKPLATSADDAAAMVQAAQNAGIMLMTAHTLRFDPAILDCKAHRHEIGSPRYLCLTLRMEPAVGSPGSSAFDGRGIVLEIGVHLLDLVRFLTGEEVDEVRCLMDAVPPETAESRLFAWLRVSGGCWVLVDISRVSSGRVGRVEWVGTEGQLEADWQTRRLRLVSASLPIKEWQVEPAPTIVATLRSFVGAVRDGAEPAVSGEDGKRAVEVAEACYESARRNGEPVKVRYR